MYCAMKGRKKAILPCCWSLLLVTCIAASVASSNAATSANAHRKSEHFRRRWVSAEAAARVEAAEAAARAVARAATRAVATLRRVLTGARATHQRFLPELKLAACAGRYFDALPTWLPRTRRRRRRRSADTDFISAFKRLATAVHHATPGWSTLDAVLDAVDARFNRMPVSSVNIADSDPFSIRSSSDSGDAFSSHDSSRSPYTLTDTLPSDSQSATTSRIVMSNAFALDSPRKISATSGDIWDSDSNVTVSPDTQFSLPTPTDTTVTYDKADLLSGNSNPSAFVHKSMTIPNVPAINIPKETFYQGVAPGFNYVLPKATFDADSTSNTPIIRRSTSVSVSSTQITPHAFLHGNGERVDVDSNSLPPSRFSPHIQEDFVDSDFSTPFAQASHQPNVAPSTFGVRYILKRPFSMLKRIKAEPWKTFQDRISTTSHQIHQPNTPLSHFQNSFPSALFANKQISGFSEGVADSSSSFAFDSSQSPERFAVVDNGSTNEVPTTTPVAVSSTAVPLTTTSNDNFWIADTKGNSVSNILGSDRTTASRLPEVSTPPSTTGETEAVKSPLPRPGGRPMTAGQERHAWRTLLWRAAVEAVGAGWNTWSRGVATAAAAVAAASKEPESRQDKPNDKGGIGGVPSLPRVALSAARAAVRAAAQALARDARGAQLLQLATAPLAALAAVVRAAAAGRAGRMLRWLVAQVFGDPLMRCARSYVARRVWGWVDSAAAAGDGAGRAGALA